MFDPFTLKQDFPILQQKTNGYPLAYLDNAATSQKPESVLQAMTAYYTTYNANIHRGLYQIAEQATAAYEESRAKVAQFIHAQPEEIIFQKSATEGLNHAARLLSENYLQAGDTILLSETEHHSNLVPWQILAKKYGYHLQFIPVDKDGRLDFATFEKLLTADVKVLAVQYISNVTGVIHPIQEMLQKAKKKGIVTVVDACQAIPHYPVNVTELDCDFLAFSGHKMLGPTGVGVLYGKKEWLEKFEPVFGGGDMIREVHREYSTWNDLPWKFEAGTPPIAEVIGLGAAVEYLEKIGLKTIHQYELELTKYALEKMQEIPRLEVIGPKDLRDRIDVISFTIEGIHPHDIAAILDQQGVAIRAGHHCAQPLMEKFGIPATARASFYLYNTKEEIDRMVEGLREVIKVFNA